ncbi:hypothetical protein CNMCM5793_005551 [Aspergillus hiratsukae]|uniref:CFEM domain-containing protein n=1 Tax=Aspergillus hiratsukae TaxID=1194566 RepID=A0A8H6UCE5_9EURO|nr:hypothetical protein CNMCM5793_005551 [Aspergillus hiratsukae]KAF7172292.1 hypothetical protein CNMCM6106_006547 [Aspergillus hiratsukae]
MRLSTILSVPLLSATVLAGPVADPAATSVPANTTDSSPEGLTNLVSIFFIILGAPPCSLECLNREIAATTACTGIFNVACLCNPTTSSNFVTRVFMCAAAGGCSAADVTRLTAALQAGCSLVGVPIGGGGPDGAAALAVTATEIM